MSKVCISITRIYTYSKLVNVNVDLMDIFTCPKFMSVIVFTHTGTTVQTSHNIELWCPLATFNNRFSIYMVQ